MDLSSIWKQAIYVMSFFSPFHVLHMLYFSEVNLFA